MFQNRNELIDSFGNPPLIAHPRFPELTTFPQVTDWITTPLRVCLPEVNIEIYHIDYLRTPENAATPRLEHLLRFQQNAFRLWYQLDGQGILQNSTQNVFGSTRQGLLGIMDVGQRHTYLHQRGAFECFIMEFALLPSKATKYFWNWGVEGKCVLSTHEQSIFENYLFNLLLAVATKHEYQGIAPAAALLQILLTVFQKNLLTFSQTQFPKNKPRHIVRKALQYMQRNFASLHHQEILARECGVDINYLNLIFRKETGQTLFKYLTTVRMEHAKHLLEENKLPIIDIAGQVGYPNNNSFARAFRKFFKESPTDYRSKHKSA